MSSFYFLLLYSRSRLSYYMIIIIIYCCTNNEVLEQPISILVVQVPIHSLPYPLKRAAYVENSQSKEFDAKNTKCFFLTVHQWRHRRG